MTFEARIAASFPNPAIHAIRDEVLQNPSLLDELFSLLYHDNLSISWRTAWILEKIQAQNPALLLTRTNALIDSLPKLKHQGARRSILKLLEDTSFDEYPVLLINFCFDRLLSPKETISVRAICIKILYKVCLQEAAFVPELKLCLSTLSSETSPGIRSTVRNTLKKLEQVTLSPQQRTRQ
jgi:hypothetical protein